MQTTKQTHENHDHFLFYLFILFKISLRMYVKIRISEQI